MKKGILLFFTLVLFQGCASAYAPYTAGQVGCDEDDVKIDHVKNGIGTTTWVAFCNNRKFYCSMNRSHMNNQTSCKEAVR